VATRNAAALSAAFRDLVTRKMSKTETSMSMLFVDDKYMGTVAGLKGRPLMLPEGPHRIELRRDGYFAHYADVTVAKGVKQRLEVTLRKEPF